jgi:tRNA A37 threonylcarbamoyladenosine dehydratase
MAIDNVRPLPSASGIGGVNSVAVTGADNAGIGSSNVIDSIDAPHVLNTNPYRPTRIGGTRWTV